VGLKLKGVQDRACGGNRGVEGALLGPPGSGRAEAVQARNSEATCRGGDLKWIGEEGLVRDSCKTGPKNGEGQLRLENVPGRARGNSAFMQVESSNGFWN